LHVELSIGFFTRKSQGNSPNRVCVAVSGASQASDADWIASQPDGDIETLTCNAERAENFGDTGGTGFLDAVAALESSCNEHLSVG
jgi:hypothetical protein